MKSGNLFIIYLFLLDISLMTEGERMFSIFTQVIPTQNMDEISFYSHLSWEQQNVTTCVTPVCLRVYKLTNKTAQFFGRMTNYQWSCSSGCATNDIISDLSTLMFTEVSGYLSNKWETGEELVNYKFKPGTSNLVDLSLQYNNGSVSQILETLQLNIGIRNDTNRINVCPTVTVLPLYQVPLGCSLRINLSPYDGDGDYTHCSWTNNLPGATLDQKSCDIKIHTSTKGGYISGQYYSGTIMVEDYSQKSVLITHQGMKSVTHGPFSKLPVMFTVYISSSLADQSDCQHTPTFLPTLHDSIGSYLYPDVYTSSFTTDDRNATMLTVGHLSVVFKKTNNVSTMTENTEWKLTANETGIYKTCVMLYSSKGVPGETYCDTLLIGDGNDCTSNNSTGRCTDQPGGHCTDYWHYYTCTYDNQGDRIEHQTSEAPASSSNTESIWSIAVIAGIACGGLFVIVAIVIGTVFLLKYISKRKHRVKSIKAWDS